MKRFGDYPAGTILEVPIEGENAICRVEFTVGPGAYGELSCCDCILKDKWDACQMFACVDELCRTKMLRKLTAEEVEAIRTAQDKK